jgi:hypothetical protein
MGRLGQLRNPVLFQLRNRMLTLMPERGQLRQLRQLFDFDAAGPVTRVDRELHRGCGPR